MTTGVGGCRGGCGSAAIAVVPKREVLSRLSPTPAQAANIAHRNGTYGDWVIDVPVQGPTDPGIRAAGCWWKDNVLDKVTDQQGAVVPRWTQSSVLCVRGRPLKAGVAGVGDPISLRNVEKLANQPATTSPAAAAVPFAGAAPDARESQWVMNTITQLNALILKAGNKPCATWPADPTKAMPAVVACFQGWFNANNHPSDALRTDGTIDDATVCALIAVTKQHTADFTTPYPGTRNCPGEGLSTIAKVGIGVGVAAVVGTALAAVAAYGGKKKARTPPPPPPASSPG
jgi:hypothetical protein